MLRLISTFVILILSLAVAPLATADAGEHAAIAPDLTADVIGVGVIELRRVDIPAFAAEAIHFGAIPENEATNAKQGAAAIQEVYGRLEKFGVRRAYAVLRTSDVAEQGMTWIVEIDRGGNAAETAKFFNDMRQELNPRGAGSPRHEVRDFLYPGEFAVINETIVAAGSPKQLERVRELHAKAASGSRSDVLEALAGLGDADAGITLVGDADSRRVLREMFPQLPAPFAAIDGKFLANDVRWAVAAVKFPPKFRWSLVADAATPEAAGVLEQAAKSGMALAGVTLLKQSIDGPPAHRERASTLLPLLALVKPRVEGKRLSISFGDDEQQIAFMRDFLPAMTQKWRNESYQNTRINHFKQIGLGLLNYASAQKDVFPAASNRDASGQPLLSWRVHVLPYLEGGQLWKEFKLDEPWDSEHNRKLIERMPEVYADPDPAVQAAIGDRGRTTFVAPIMEGAVFAAKEGISWKDIKDGTSNTIMTVEVVPERAVVWTKPDDWEVDLAHALAGVKRNDRERFVAGWCDGSVRYLSNEIDPAVLKKLLTYAGGEVVGNDEIK
ncbi:DUF1559 domain-containing protein [Lacipirellula sp.]|uniref:DUF1559 family PulG-like putative transporter n=1 Tax=Lacipirellula sp. TaxID=2691419 RepID=UPI003D0F3D6A